MWARVDTWCEGVSTCQVSPHAADTSVETDILV